MKAKNAALKGLPVGFKNRISGKKIVNLCK